MTGRSKALVHARRKMRTATRDYASAIEKHLPIGHRTVHYKGSRAGVPCMVIGHPGHGEVMIRAESGAEYFLDATWLAEFEASWREDLE